MVAKKSPSMNDVKASLSDKPSIASKVSRQVSGSQIRQSQQNSLNWFFKTIKSSANDYKRGSFNSMQHPFIGGMFHFLYDPKHKDTLPYYDKFPLVIPINIYSDGFLGLNLHYVPPLVRAKLLDALIDKYKTSANSKTYMNVTYQMLQGAVNSEWFAPCVHRYLSSHMRSNAVMVTPDLWGEVAFLPTQKFEKATHRQVWAESAKRR